MKPGFCRAWRVSLLVCALCSVPAIGQEPGDAFAMEVVDRFRIADGGVVVTGIVAGGKVSVGDTVCLVSESGARRELSVTGIEMFRKILDSAAAGDQVALLVTGVDLEHVAAGDRLVASCD